MDATIKWAQEVLGKQVQVEPVVETPFSCVRKLQCGAEIFYFKQTPPPLFVEAQNIAFLRSECGVTNIPEIIAQNADLHCFIMKPCGIESLRTMFAKKFDMALYLKGVDIYKAIQRATERHVDALLAKGTPDWRLSRLPQMYNAAVDDSAFLQRCGLTDDQSARLRELKGAFAGLCEELASFGVLDCLTHSDWQPNNMLADAAGNVCVIDWGEVAVGNPLLAITKCLKTVAGPQKFDDATYRMAEARFYRDYFASDADMKRGVRIVEKLSFIHYLFTMRKLEELTGHTSEQWNGKMTFALTAFIDAMK